MDIEWFYIGRDKADFKIQVQVSGGTEEEREHILKTMSFEMDSVELLGLEIDRNIQSFNRTIYGFKKKINSTINDNGPKNT
jgi:hypothetical protein